MDELVVVGLDGHDTVIKFDRVAVFKDHVGIRRDGTLVFSGDGSRTAELEKLQQAVRLVFRNNKKESYGNRNQSGC